MTLPRLQISERMRSHMRYAKLSTPTPRILIFESQYWIDGACRNAAQTLGWEVQSVPVLMEGTLPRETIKHLLETLVNFRPDFILSINLSGMDEGGLFARLFEDLEIPHVTWFVDDPRTILMDRTCYATPFTVALTWEPAYKDYLSNLGFACVTSLPLAADLTLFNAEPLDRPDLPPAFVGNSMIEFAEREREAVAQYPELYTAIDIAFRNGGITRETFAKGLETILPKTLTATLTPDQKRHAEIYCFVEGTARLRHHLIQKLKPEGLVVRGDTYWTRITTQAGGPVNYFHDLPDFYRHCTINLNATSIQMATTVNQRVFDCPAAGGFLLTDSQQAIDELLATGEMIVYNDLEECIALFRWYHERPEARKQIIHKARTRILNEHTYAHRLERITQIVREQFGG